MTKQDRILSEVWRGSSFSWWWWKYGFLYFFSSLGVPESRPDTEGYSEPGSGLWLRETPGGDARNFNTQGNASPVQRSRIRDVLIRIRILGSILLDYGCGSGSCIFCSVFQTPTKKYFFVFVLFIITIPVPTEVGTFTSVLRDKLLIKMPKTVISTLFFRGGGDSGCIRWSGLSGILVCLSSRHCCTFFNFVFVKLLDYRGYPCALLPHHHHFPG